MMASRCCENIMYGNGIFYMGVPYLLLAYTTAAACGVPLRHCHRHVPLKYEIGTRQILGYMRSILIPLCNTSAQQACEKCCSSHLDLLEQSIRS
eukprot:scaffold526830_cov63-Attheya_sp.AAC.1